MSSNIPPEIEPDLRRATRLEYWTIGWMLSIITIMGLVMGSSQAMKTAWFEDLLSLIPSIVFLIALRLERKGPTRMFPFGFTRFNSLAFLASAVALTAMGSALLFESAMTLIKQEHVTIEPIELFGQSVWQGWLMIAALAYSVVPPVILGRMKLPVAERLQDKVLHTDALMQKADWMTGLAGIAGVLGLGLGYWWADAVAAGLISFSILKDGVQALKMSAAELVDGVPRKLDKDEIADDARALHDRLEERFPGGDVRLRETGRYINAEVSGVASPDRLDLAELWPGDPGQHWRFAQLSFLPPEASENPNAA